MTLKYAMRHSAPFVFGHSIRSTVASVDLFRARCRVAKAIWEGDVAGTEQAVKRRDELKAALKEERRGLFVKTIQFAKDLVQR